MTQAAYTRQIDLFCDKAQKVLTDVARTFALDYRDAVAAKTPILTGRAAASWNVSRGTPDYSVKSPDYNNPSSAPSDGNIDIEGVPGTPFYVTNAIPYLPQLNNGSSTKAPAAFVETTYYEMLAKLPRIVMEVRKLNNL
jgi:hypothetical protein